MVLSYLKSNSELKANRRISENDPTLRIGRTSYQRIVIPAIEDINWAVSRYIPGFNAFKLVQEIWRDAKYHKSIRKNESIGIQEDEKFFYIEVPITKNESC